MLKIFIGYDCRQPIAYTVLQHSIVSRASQPVSITPLIIEQLPIERQGLTQFTYSRFLVPYLCNYQGWALFLDADMLVLSDIVELFNLKDSNKALMVIKNKLRFEWPSLMLFNCEKCRILTPQFIETTDAPLNLNWLDADLIGELPAHWNHLVGYDAPNPNAKLVHFTKGMPVYRQTKDCEFAQEWKKAHVASSQIAPLEELMANSVHYADNNFE